MFNLFCARRVLRCLAVLCLEASAAQAQPAPVVRGTVADKATGEQLLGATVRRAGQPASATATDLDGAFTLPWPASAGPDTLVVSYVGYRPWRLVLAGAPAQPLAVRMVPAAGLALGQVEVTAKRPIAEDFMVRELDFLSIVTNPAAAADPLLAVRTLPAATTLDESANISLRGSDPSQTGIYLNNVPVYDAVKFSQLNGLGTFGIFSVDMVRSVAVFPSNSPLEFGNAGAGLISLTTDERVRPRFVQASLGLANSGLLAGQPVGRRGMLKMYLNVQDGTALRALSPGAFRQLRRFGLVDGGVHYATKIGEYGTLRAFAYGLGEQYAYRPAASNTAYEYRNRRGFCTLSYEQAWPRADLALSHGLSQRRAADAFGTYRSTRRAADYFAAAHYRRYWNAQLSTRVGLSYDERRLRIRGEFPQSAGTVLAPDAPVYAASFGRGRALWEAYQYTKLTRGAWVLGAGLRANAAPRPAQPGYLSAQLNVRRNLSAHRFLNLSGGQYHSFTSPDPVRFGFLRTRIRQVALDYSAVSAAPDGPTLTAAVYAKHEQSAALRHAVVGAEVFGQRTFWGRLRADLTAATVHATRFRYDAANPEARALALGQQRQQVRFQLKSTLRLVGKWGELGTFAQYRAGAPFTPILGAHPDPITGAPMPIYAPDLHATYLPNYFRADLTASKFIRRRTNANTLVLYVTCSNVLNTRNVRSYAYTADYAQAIPEYFQRRVVYFGLVKTWQ